MEFIDKNTIKLDKEINELDKFAFDFCKIVSKHAKYVVISGYVAILFGRSRGTEDVDIFIEKLDKEKFEKLFYDLSQNGYECITASKEQAYENLSEKIPIRFAKKKQFIPNIELKFAEKLHDMQSLRDNLRVVTSYGEIRVSYIEPQIAFKEQCLGTEKDLEDAMHLRKIFKDEIDEHKIQSYKRIFREG